MTVSQSVEGLVTKHHIRDILVPTLLEPIKASEAVKDGLKLVGGLYNYKLKRERFT